MNIKIQNEELAVEISTLGAEMKSIKDSEGVERQWNGDPNVWAGQAPVMWPICGGLKNDEFIFNGIKYQLEKHGYGRKCEFECEKHDKDSAVFLLKSDENSKKHYPFDYELRIIYKLIENRIDVIYNIKNFSEDKMYFSIGGHEAYACLGGIEECSVIFEKEETLDRFLVDGNLLNYKKVRVLENSNILNLKNEYFEDDALIFKKLKSRKVILVNHNTGKKIYVEFEGFDYLLIWTKVGAQYVCIEPWTGIPDSIDSSGELTEKEGITCLEKGDTIEKKHTIIIE